MIRIVKWPCLWWLRWPNIWWHSLWRVMHEKPHRMCYSRRKITVTGPYQKWGIRFERKVYCECGYGNNGVTFDQEIAETRGEE